VRLFRKKGSKYWWYDFKLPGVPRQRGSTKETNETRAESIAAIKLSAANDGRYPLRRKVPTLLEQWESFEKSQLYLSRDADTRRYYKNGWRMIEQRPIAKMRLNAIRSTDIADLPIPGSASNVNNVRKTMRRLLHLAVDADIIAKCPRIPLLEEKERTVILDEAAERALLPVSPQPLKDIIVLMRELGMRNARELYCMKIELIEWQGRTYRVPASKTDAGERYVPLPERALEILRQRCEGREKGYVFPSRRKGKHITGGLVNKQWVKARQDAGLPKDLVLYTGRHDYGTFLMEATGNLKAVMLAMGHADVKSALRYQRPRLDPLREALDKRSKKATVLKFRAHSRAQR
jgi:integrase